MAVVNKYTARTLVKQLRRLLTGMFKANILRKTRSAGDGIEPGWTVSAVYSNLDCDVQAVTRRDLEGIQTSLAGNILLTMKVGYFPRYLIDGRDYSELSILADDQVQMVSSSGEKYAVRRVDSYEDHYELILEPINS